MRVAYVCADPGVPVFGQKGCSIHVQEVIRALQRQGAQVELFATRLGGNPPADFTNVQVHPLPAIPKGDRAVREQVALATNPGLRLQLELAGSFDLVYERYSLWSFSAIEYAKWLGIPGLLEVNAPLIEEQATHRGLVDRASAEDVARRVFNAATALIAVSAEVKTYLERYVADTSSIQIIPNGVNPDRFSAHLQPLDRPHPFTIGFVGTLKPWHGLPILIDAFDRFHHHHPDSRLLIVGDGPEKESLMADVTTRELQAAVQFTGAIAPNDVPAYLATMDVAVAPYPNQANFYFSPLKVYEYMAAGLPVVASQIGQLSDVINDGVTGLLCPPGDAIALTAALDQLWRSPKLASQLGQAARKTVTEHHTWDAIAQRLLQVAGMSPPPLAGGVAT
ncbi:glycosyltransferase family 4 protein [Oculatella sp. LEGE 06141]|uniref:glycosyltransferase family 4 protein n=1 Tax=Oculatella sp. LEGE 06141 TaxID=1828648 RepID=UPI001882C501|nr:glycosyltransferase family 4 protein [Oculatella sp. LEGE 06141]MBE9180302.1 glycosyltransferase family 4 protein [Oculatella sp. LEGE 06141]